MQVLRPPLFIDFMCSSDDSRHLLQCLRNRQRDQIYLVKQRYSWLKCCIWQIEYFLFQLQRRFRWARFVHHISIECKHLVLQRPFRACSIWHQITTVASRELWGVWHCPLLIVSIATGQDYSPLPRKVVVQGWLNLFDFHYHYLFVYTQSLLRGRRSSTWSTPSRASKNHDGYADG
jgi:hypothetical protein